MKVKKPDKVTIASANRNVSTAAKRTAQKDGVHPADGMSSIARCPGKPASYAKPAKLAKGNVPAKQLELPKWAKDAMKPAKPLDKGDKRKLRSERD